MQKENFELFLSRVISGFGQVGDSGDLKTELDMVAGVLSKVQFTTRAVERVNAFGLRHMETAVENARQGLTAELAVCLKGIYQEIYWSTFYPRNEKTLDFVDELAVGEIIGPRGPVLSNEIILGALVLGPDTYYPPHAHRASEIYYIVSGTPLFKAGQGDWETKPPGSLFFHPGDLVHATRTERDPMLALYTWRGDITSPAYFIQDSGPAHVPAGDARFFC